MKRQFRKELIGLLLEALCRTNKCERCGKPNVSVNHIIPIFKGGKNKLDNIEFLCPKCMKNTRNLNFERGNKRSYQRAYMKWYLSTHPKQLEKILESNRKRNRSKYYPLYFFGIFWRRIYRKNL